MAIKQYPNPSIVSSEWATNSLWIELEPRKVVNQKNVDTNFILTDPIGDKYRFMAPNELQENIRHVWEPLENIMASLSQKISSTASIIAQGTQVYKIDTPLMYKDSNRREITFAFQVLYTGVTKPRGTENHYDYVYKEVMEPVKNLMSFSSANISQRFNITDVTEGEFREQLNRVQLPYVFRIKSVKGDGNAVDLVNIRTAALTSVQPTYYGPYIEGLPIRCELTLTFNDIEPLDKDRSFGKNVTITQGEK